MSWCTDHNDFVDPFHFKLCGATKRTAANISAIQSHAPGLYVMPSYPKQYAPWDLADHIEGIYPGSLWNDKMISAWRQKIIDVALNHCNVTSWRPKNHIYVAVHLRRGDISADRHKHAWVSERKINRIIEMTRRYCSQYLKKNVKVHLFSEHTSEYDWNLIQGVDDFPSQMDFHFSFFVSLKG